MTVRCFARCPIALNKSAHFYLPRQADRLEEAIINYRNGRSMDETQYKFVPRQSAVPPMIRPAPIAVNAGSHLLRVAVIQDGARLHYAVPIALQRAGALRLMFSEGFMRRGTRSKLIRSIAGRLSSRSVRALLQRRADEIPPQLVRTNAFLAARQQLSRKRFATDESYYEWASRAVGNWVRRQGIDDANTLFGFVRNIDPQLCKEYHSRGILTVADQMIAPAAVENAEAEIQARRWPDWQMPERKADLKLVQQVEQLTWAELDLITCGSSYVRDGLISQGIHPRRVAVLPYPIDAARYPTSSNQPVGPADRQLTIGFLGGVGLRKGVPYFLEVARRLKSDRLRFVMVGPTQLPETIKKLLSESVELIGRVPRAQTVDWLLKFDMFLFPSTCEGNAGAVTEAMATGLPIITSPNSGTPVRDGIEGFIRSYDDIDGMCQCVEQLASNPALRRDMGTASRAMAHELSLENYGKQLVQAMVAARANP